MKKLLEIIFNLNIFYFKNKKDNSKRYFRQIKGIAMGTICGPTLANIVVYHLERKWLTVNRPIIYRRYIDDIFIVSQNLINLEDFKSSFLNLKLNIETGDLVQFLDLVISKNILKNRLKFSLYIKPTNTFSYLQTTSNHPNSIFKNIPISILIRIRRICSDYTDFLHFSRLILYQLLCRGYQFGYLCKAIDSIGKIKRESLIPYKTKIKSFNLNNKVIFNSKFDLNLTDERKIFYSIWDK